MRVHITEEFTGYPDDTDKSRTDYRVGQTLDLDETFARLIIGKGHGQELRSQIDCAADGLECETVKEEYVDLPAPSGRPAPNTQE